MADWPKYPPTNRVPLGEATRRMNNVQNETAQSPKKSTLAQLEHHDRCLLPRHEHSDAYLYHDQPQAGSPSSSAVNPRLSAISKDYATDSKRSSQISNASTNASDGKKRKSCVGPWQLGITLGSGSTARVRLARHRESGQKAAIKIIHKKFAQMTQAGSLQDLDKAESSHSKLGDGARRMPIGIEREIAIMKLVQHPNIMRLYDIWENRAEIYLVLEYVDGGELFGAITANGRLTEPEAFVYFRQYLSAVSYCHSLNICHRDLKPENILLTRDGQIKVADFGMAALHQSPDHKLRTSCGSPHYAAPEVVKGGTYRGDKTDIWSLGVILYATLAGKLPFDTDVTGDELVAALVPKIKKGVYTMPEDFSPEAANLIWRMLQVNPRDRINMSQIWQHSIVRKYAVSDTQGGGPRLSPSLNECRNLVLRRSDISTELLGHLRSLWHRLTEEQLVDALLSKEPNEQKMFYSLLSKYREAQLESYTPEPAYSASDYHHASGHILKKTYSTCHFPQPKSKGHKRQASRFTVISNAADTERSYDPFKASRPQHLDSMRPADHAKITIHRRGPSYEGGNDIAGGIKKPEKTSQTYTSVTARSESGRQQLLVPSQVIASRSSLASSTRSKNSGSGVRASVGHPRGVSFSHRRRRSGGSQRKVSSNIKSAASDGSTRKEDAENAGEFINIPDELSISYNKSKKAQTTTLQPLLPGSRPGRGSQIWNEDVRQLSSSLAMTCDEAFNRSSVIADVENKAQDLSRLSDTVKRASLLGYQQPIDTRNSRVACFDDRPLPPPPARTESTKIQLLEARKQAEIRKASVLGESTKHLDRMVSHIDRLMEISSPERRTSSAPAEGKYHSSGRPLPSINEAGKEEESPRRHTDLDKYPDSQRGYKNRRIASAPEPREAKKNHENGFMRSEAGMRDTIRMVDRSSPSPVKVPAPLTIRKKSSRGGQTQSGSEIFSPGSSRSSSNATKSTKSGLELRQQYLGGLGADLKRINEDYDRDQFVNGSSAGTVIKKKPLWFKRNSKSDDGAFRLSNDPYIHPLLPVPPKKKGFTFSRFFRKRKLDMSIGETGFDGDDISLADSIADIQTGSHDKRTPSFGDPEKRLIEPQQNWLAKLFNVKPASKVICFSVSDRRARQEIVTILKQWKRYGIRDLQVDKKGNRVFGKVAAKNFLDMKEVAFAAEVMKVIEHGRKSHLSIARFTQELGAASSFHKVVETMEGVLKCRGMLVADDRKRSMMIKTLNST